MQATQNQTDQAIIQYSRRSRRIHGFTPSVLDIQRLWPVYYVFSCYDIYTPPDIGDKLLNNRQYRSIESYIIQYESTNILSEDRLEFLFKGLTNSIFSSYFPVEDFFSIVPETQKGQRRQQTEVGILDFMVMKGYEKTTYVCHAAPDQQKALENHNLQFYDHIIVEVKRESNNSRDWANAIDQMASYFDKTIQQSTALLPKQADYQSCFGVVAFGSQFAFFALFTGQANFYVKHTSLQNPISNVCLIIPPSVYKNNQAPDQTEMSIQDFITHHAGFISFSSRYYYDFQVILNYMRSTTPSLRNTRINEGLQKGEYFYSNERNRQDMTFSGIYLI